MKSSLSSFWLLWLLWCSGVGVCQGKPSMSNGYWAATNHAVSVCLFVCQHILLDSTGKQSVSLTARNQRWGKMISDRLVGSRSQERQIERKEQVGMLEYIHTHTQLGFGQQTIRRANQVRFVRSIVRSFIGPKKLGRERERQGISVCRHYRLVRLCTCDAREQQSRPRLFPTRE